MAKRKTPEINVKQRKTAAIAMITSASDDNTPEGEMYKSLLDRAVEDIGHVKYDSTQDWKDGLLDGYMIAINIEPSYAARVLKKTGLI